MEAVGQDMTEGENAPAEAGRFAAVRRLLAWPARLWRRRAAQAPEEPDAGAARSEAHPENDGEARPAVRRWLKPALIGSALLVAAVAGAGAAWLAFSHTLKAQEAELDHRASEMARQEVEIVQRDQKLDKLHKEAEAQKDRARRAEAEARLARSSDPAEPAAPVHKEVREAPPRPAAPALPAANATAQPAPPAGGECRLTQGALGSALKNCIEEFNRQSR